MDTEQRLIVRPRSQSAGGWGLAAIALLILASCEPPKPPAQHEPSISAISANPSVVNIGGTVSLGVSASDSDGGALSYAWTASAGTFNTSSGQNVTWTAPNVAGNVTITATVTDNTGLKASTSAQVSVTLSDLQVTAFSATSQQGKVVLAWQNPVDGRFSQVMVRTSDTTTPTSLADGLEVYKGSGTTFDHTTYNGSALVAGKTYYYSIWVIYNDSSFSALRVSSSAAPTAVPTVPVAPANVQVSVNSSTSLTVSWDQGSANTDAYIVERMSGGGSFAAVGSQLPSSQTSFTDSGLTPATAYTYRILAKNAVGNSNPSSQATGTTQAAASAPLAPTSLAISSQTVSSVSIAWTDNSSTETGFKVYRRINNANETIVALPANTTTYTDSSISAGFLYTYEVRATNGAGDSVASNQISFDTQVPTVPAGLTANLSSVTAATLTWTDSLRETGYTLERGLSPSGPWPTTLSTTIPAGSTQYLDSTLSAGVVYAYRLKAVNQFGDSGYATVTVTPTAPASPIGLMVTALSNGSVTLTWTDASDNETAFKVYRRKDGGSESGAVVNSGLTYTDNTLVVGSVYTFDVRATNGGGESAASNVVTIDARTPTVPGSIASSSTTTSVTITWTDSTSETSYTLERGTAAGGPWTIVSSSIAAGSTQYVDSGLATGVTYFYRLKAVNVFAASAYATVSDQTGLPTGIWNTHNWDAALWGN